MDIEDTHGDETISLSDVLVARDTCLPEDELWALCRECCLVLEVVNNSPDQFQTLCVTPDTVAFDQVGNVCFLDLDMDPEPIYLPPEFSQNGNTYQEQVDTLSVEQAHLFSLGMTLLYAAEYNATSTQEAVTPELRDLLGRMTSDSPAARPDLESTIILCEEQLCGQSSQEVCCGIAAVAGFGLSAEESYPADDPQSFISNISPDDISRAESVAYSSDQADVTCCDDIPDLTEDISQVESLPASEQGDTSLTEQGEITADEVYDDSFQDENESSMENRRKRRISPQVGKSSWGMNEGKLNGFSTDVNQKPAIPKKPSASGAHSKPSGAETDLRVTELASETDSEKSQIENLKNKALSASKSDTKNGSKTGEDTKGLQKQKGLSTDKNQNITYLKYTEEEKPPPVAVVDKTVNSVSVKQVNTQGYREDVETAADTTAAKGRRSKRKQGLTISDILEALDRPLREEELWALCKEGTAALQRKKKHLPAYLSPDTLLIRESGNVSFKAIPEEKPLEVIFMAPELQAKGELSEKTCLFGLSVTLRCAAGKKYAPVSAMSASADLKDLLTFLSDGNPNKRPELVDIAKICNEHSNGKSSDEVCAAMFLEAFRALTATEESVVSSKEKPSPKDIPVAPPSVTPSAFKPMSGSSFQPVKQAPITMNSGAFCPVPKKPGDIINKKEVPEPRIPSAFSSPSTHFKPIILHNSSETANEKQSSLKEEPSVAKDSKASKPSAREKEKVTSPDSAVNNDKEVMKKLKELKKNLMKHHQPSMAKEIENEDNEDKPADTVKELPEKTSRKSLPPTPKKSSSSKSSSGKRKASGGALEALLKEIQKQGNVPDTQSLAAAIAQHLTSHLSTSQGQGQDASVAKGDSKQAKQQTSELDMSVTSAQSLLDQGQSLSNLNIPSQYHSQLLGHTMTLPNVPVAGGIMPALPQFQFQQDPVTGFLQLVPVNVLNLRPQSVHSNSGSAHSNSAHEVQSPQISPRTAHNQSDVSNVSAISDSVVSKSKGQRSRSAKGLVQKTANLRAKNLGRPSPLNTLSPPKDIAGMYKWKSDHCLDQPQGEGNLSLRPGYVYDDSLITATSLRNHPYQAFTRPQSTSYGLQLQRPPRTHSNSSSPSPSKDSGVSGMFNGVYRNYPQGTDASLMERLLGSHSNIKQQQQEVIGKIIHLLRDEFGFDGYMENGVEDVAVAEYISSLGDLKWDTFTNAIGEKYSDLYWGTELLANLFSAVNGGRPQSANRNTYPRSRRTTELKPVANEDDSSGLSEYNDSSRTRTRPQHNGQLPPFPGGGRPHSTHLGVSNKPQTETSDSTDSERVSGKRSRRPRRKHELDKIKSSSSGNLITNDGGTGTNQRKIPLEQVVTTATTSASNTQSLSTLSPSAAKPPFPPSSAVQKSPKVENNHPSHNQSHDQSKPVLPVSAARTGGNQSSSQTHLAVNGTQEGQRSLSREVSISSHSSSQSEIGHHGDRVHVDKKGHVVYHWTMIQLSMSPEMERFMHDIDEENCKLLQDKLLSLEQQIKMERRQRRQTQKFYKKLVESNRNAVPLNKADKLKSTADRNQLLQVAKNITEMTQRIVFIDLCRTHIQMLLAELQGIAASYLYSIAVCLEDEPLQLHPKPDNPLLQFQNIREPHSGLEIQALHAGTPEGLMAYLFASTALSEGFLHQFLFCFRYFTTATNVLHFLISRYESASKAGSTEMNIGRLQQRVLDLLHFWLEGYFSVDFQGKQSLVDSLKQFIKEYVGEESEGGLSLQALLGNCLSRNNLELSSADPDDTEMHFWQREQPRLKQVESQKTTEWESFKSLVRGKSNAKNKKGKVSISAVVVERRRPSAGSQESLPIIQHSRRSDMFMLTDYTVQNLAEQLCLIEQGIFQLTHPVHYLNSKCQGVGVALTMKATRTPAPTRRNETEDGRGLFLEPLQDTSAIQKMIDHAQEVGHWVAGEIVACSSPKTQVTVLAKFLMIAHTCVELRNYATSMAILDGLENLIIKQLAAWKHLPSKCAAIMTELSTTRMFLKNDPLSLMQQAKDCHLYPTIPSAVIFLLHIQQLEIGGFKLANQMYKWGKIRSISQVIDQVRIFREHIYGFEADHPLQDTLRQRIHEMSSQDIQTLASQHDINFQKMSSATGLSGAFKKMKGKLGGK